jgi:hypothetical protein
MRHHLQYFGINSDDGRPGSRPQIASIAELRLKVQTSRYRIGAALNFRSLAILSRSFQENLHLD